MEQQIIELIEEEVSRRVSLQMTVALEKISNIYGISIERLSKDTADVETKFCKGILKSRKRCLKTPRDNGYCGFHQHQVPPPPPKPMKRIEAPWQLT
jgi:hypothetical protein